MATIHWLDPAKLDFPPLGEALDEPNGLLAVGGDLRSERLLGAYRRGIFPWYEDPQPILWWSPDPRTVLFPDRLHVSRTLRRRLLRGDFEVSLDCAFADVVNGCAELGPRRRGTWITADMFKAYLALHEQGWGHSLEVWQQGELIGGIYGVAIGRVFYGESMFSRVSDASKIALVYLCGQMRHWGFRLLDCQVGNEHLYRMGAEDIAREDFVRLLDEFTTQKADAPPRWRLDWGYSS